MSAFSPTNYTPEELTGHMISRLTEILNMDLEGADAFFMRDMVFHLSVNWSWVQLLSHDEWVSLHSAANSRDAAAVKTACQTILDKYLDNLADEIWDATGGMPTEPVDVDAIENDPTIPEDEKARLYPGVHDLYLAELRSRDAIDFDFFDADYEDERRLETAPLGVGDAYGEQSDPTPEPDCTEPDDECPF